MSTGSSLTSSADSDASEASENTLSNPQVSERFRQRMQPCKEPVWQRSRCACCGRNFRDTSDCLDKFRDYLQQRQSKLAAADSASAVPLADFSEAERQSLLSEDFLRRLLARCSCDFKRAEERLVMAHAVHKKYSLDTCRVCQVCIDRPGFHSFRQVGFDRLGRPVLYTCLNQDLETGTQPDQIRDYFVHLILTVVEAEKTIPASQHSLVLVFDTNGLGLAHVRNDAVSQFGGMLKYFPSRLSYALLLNMSSVTRYLLKPIIHLTGHQDDVLILNSRAVERQLSECFDPPLVRWMLREMERNTQPKQQFCIGPSQQQQQQQDLSQHDPRGEASYVANFISKSHQSGHKPHPSIAAQRSATM